MNVVARNLGQAFLTLIVGAVAFLVMQSICMAAELCGLPDNWRSLPLNDFVKVLDHSVELGTFDAGSNSDQGVVREHGKRLFSQIDVSKTQLDYKTVDTLHWLVNRVLDKGVNDRVRNQLLARQDDWTGKPYSEIRAKFTLMERLGFPLPVCIAEARRWVKAGGTIEQVDQADRSLEVVRTIFTDAQTIQGSFSVRWEALLTPADTGTHTLSISPINVNSANPKAPVKLSMNVAVEGQSVLNATPQSWVRDSTPIKLTAGQPVALVVNLNAEVHAIPPGTLHALLYWQGPGVAKAIIPTGRLTQPGTGNPGFRATYTWTDQNGQPQSITRTDRTIDMAWTSTELAVAQDTTLSDEIADSNWRDMSTEEYLTWCETSDVKIKEHPFIKEQMNAAAGLSSERRGAFLGKLLAHPRLVDVMSPKDIVNFYQSFRIGAEDRALELFGKWAVRQADYTSGLSDHPAFEIEAREAFRKMALSVTQQLPEQVAQLQSDYLELPDGRCCLPVAYTLAYSYLGRGQLDQWIALLDARLSDNAVTGDKRINWLLARAHAEEIRFSPPDPFATAYSRPIDGRGYLDEGLIVAESASSKIRIANEIAARLASAHQLSAANEVLQQVANSVPEAERTSLSAAQQHIAALQAAQTEGRQARAAGARQAYVDALKKRRDRAAAAGNTDAVGRYDTLINAAGSP